MIYAAIVASLGVVILGLLLFVRWKWRHQRYVRWLGKLLLFPEIQEEEEVSKLTAEVQGPNTVPSAIKMVEDISQKIQGFELEKKDSLDEQLDVLTKQLAEKEGRLKISKTKVRETQFEIDNLQALDQDVQTKYDKMMDSLKSDLIANEMECKSLQDQIEWVSLKRAEIHDEVCYGQKLYSEAAAELATNLSELQRGRTDFRAKEKPIEPSITSLRHRKEPDLTNLYAPLVIKSPPFSSRSNTPTQSYIRPQV